jgi:hypothetical protein
MQLYTYYVQFLIFLGRILPFNSRSRSQILNHCEVSIRAQVQQ